VNTNLEPGTWNLEPGQVHNLDIVQILLMSMPDSFEHTPTLAVRMPNGALASLAGNVDPQHHVAIADLVLAQASVQNTVTRLMRDLQPELVGLSVMTFQRSTARRIISLVKSVNPNAKIVVGGYDPSLAPEAWMHPALDVDFIVRGEGDLTFRELVRALDEKRSPATVDGLWYRTPDGMQRTLPRPVTTLDRGEIKPPRRDGRVLSGYTYMGRPIDVVETSRGCTFDCSFCSIIEMRGRNFHRLPIDRVVADIRDAHDRGARAIFIVDDNITIDVTRFEALCRAIVDAGLDDIHYLVQAMTASIAQHGETLAPLMRRAGFRYVFLGIENILEDDLAFLKAAAKNTRRGPPSPNGLGEAGSGRQNATMAAIDVLHRHGMFVVGGLIVGNPDDTRAAIDANLTFAKKYVDWPYIQHPTPYPGTPMTKDFRDRGLIVNAHVDEYDGTSAVTRSAHLDADEIEYLRWRADRWMKVRHIPAAMRLYPGFVITHARRMMAHTFRGTTWRSLLGLESTRETFRRYKQIRARERTYLDWPDPAPSDPDVRHTLGISQKHVYDGSKEQVICLSRGPARSG
jgi:anaerobic magnesium-protoporphyrin IX monomethyl ester cyclase